jgi:hypothetical protein
MEQMFGNAHCTSLGLRSRTVAIEFYLSTEHAVFMQKSIFVSATYSIGFLLQQGMRAEFCSIIEFIC